MTQTGWTLEGYVAHNEALREADAKFHQERDQRYQERDVANKMAVRAALDAADKASEKTEMALKEYKIGANEWRSTVQDVLARGQGKDTGGTESRGQIAWVVAIIASLIAIGSFVFRAQPQPVVILPAGTVTLPTQPTPAPR